VNPALPLSFVFGFLVFEGCRYAFAGTGWRINSSRRAGFEPEQAGCRGQRAVPTKKTAAGLMPAGRHVCTRNPFRSNSPGQLNTNQMKGSQLTTRAGGLNECGLRSRLLRITLGAMQ
jgi:hypothetical protein